MAIRQNTRRNSTAKNSKAAQKKMPATGCLIWLVLFLITLILFVLNWDTIQQTLKDTSFFEAISSSKNDQPPPASPDPLPVVAEPAGSGDGSAPTAGNNTAAGNTQQTDAATDKPYTPAPPNPATSTETTGSTTPTPTTTPTAPTNPIELIRQTRLASLYFIKVDDDGSINRREVKRTVSSSDSPMTDALQALLKGPSAEELNQNLVTLIPAGTRLISAQVRGSTAYLNFSEEFMYNRYGIEGYAGQLKQIIFTATEFPTVKDVFFHIEGQTREYLGGEGVYIGKPLSRTSF
ncbi:MAG: GerMN domain-containing protein [Spirochaetes bacterium]|nr:GerMN domain-containing protein [Spirochaetota bacterium]